MKIYLQSAGQKPNQDYRWYEITTTDGGMEPKEPEFLEQARHWVDLESPSLLLWRADHEIRLLIINLAAKGRVDYRGRPLRNYIAMTGVDDEETNLRALAINYLKDRIRDESHCEKSFEEKIGDCITNSLDCESGFAANKDNLEAVIKDIISETTGVDSKPPEKKKKEKTINLPTKENIGVLAEELKCNALDTNDLVVVTSSLDPMRWGKKCPLWWGLTEMATAGASNEKQVDTGDGTETSNMNGVVNTLNGVVNTAKTMFEKARYLIPVLAIIFCASFLFEYSQNESLTNRLSEMEKDYKSLDRDYKTLIIQNQSLTISRDELKKENAKITSNLESLKTGIKNFRTCSTGCTKNQPYAIQPPTAKESCKTQCANLLFLPENTSPSTN